MAEFHWHLDYCKPGRARMPRTALVGANRRLAGDVMRFDDFVDQKQVGEQGAKMDGGVQIIDQLRTDDGLGEYDFDRGERILRIPRQHRYESLVAFWVLQTFLLHRIGTDLGKAGERRRGAAQEVADHSAFASLTGQTLPGEGQHVFVTLFNNVAARRQFFEHW